MSIANPALNQAAIRQYAKHLRLPTVGGQFERLAGEAVKHRHSHLSYLETLLEAEVEERKRKAVERRIQESRLPAVKLVKPGPASRTWRQGWRWRRAVNRSECGSPRPPNW